jgi:hypothetical protein
LSQSERNFLGLIFVLFVILALSLIMLLFISASAQSYGLSLILVFGVISLLVVLTIASTVLRHINACRTSEALGLPPGSVRAIIALSLIVIFAIMAVYMYGDLSTRPMTLFSNMTTVYPNGTISSFLNSTDIIHEPNQAQKDFSLQALTTVSTLVVALAGFYFGTRSVETAQDGGDREENPAPS